MQLRRIFLACSILTSASFAFADLIDLNNPQASMTTSGEDRLGQLTQTLAQGSYVESVEQEVEVIADEANSDLSANSNEPSIELNNATIEKKYGPSAISAQFSALGSSLGSSIHSWLVTHPLPNSRVSSAYGGRTMNGRAEKHSGLDLAAPTGTPIYATGPGLVTKSGWGTGYGQYVEVNHGNGYITRYAHASRLIARVGDRVQAGEEIAKVGCTGRCTGPHLHYEVVKDGQRKNPATYLAMLP